MADISELKKIPRLLKQKCRFKLAFYGREVFRDYSILIKLYKMGGVSFHLVATNGFHVQSENVRFAAAGLLRHQGPVSRKSGNFSGAFRVA